MFRYADPQACPVCRSSIPSGAPACDQCGTRLSGSIAASLFRTLTQADALVSQLAALSANSTAARTEVALSAPAHPAYPAPTHTAVPARGQRTGLSAASVPKILLGLGATCLLVAAVVFLAVAWSSLGVSGRTLVLVLLTAVAVGLSMLLSFKGLRAGAEAFMTVGLGLLTLDVFGAGSAGWINSVGSHGFQATLGAVLTVVGLGTAYALRRSPIGPLISAQIVGAIGIGLLPTSIPSQSNLDRGALLVLLTLLVLSGAAFATHRLRLPAAAITLLIGASFMWLLLALIGTFRVGPTPTLAEVWTRVAIWPLLAAALVGVILALVTRLPTPVRVAASGVAVLLGCIAITLPVLDESPSAQSLVGLTLILAACAVSLRVARPWRAALVVPPTLSALGLAVGTLVLTVRAVDALLSAGGTWTASAGAMLTDPGLAWHWPLFLPGGVLGVLLTVWLAATTLTETPVRRFALPAGLTVAASATLLPALYGAPLAVAVGVLVAATLALTAVAVISESDARPVASVLACAAAPLTVVASLQSEVLTAVVTGTLALVAAGLAHGAKPLHRAIGDIAFTPFAALFVWTVLDLSGVDQVWRSVPLLVIAGGWAILRARPEREIPAIAVAAVGSAWAISSGAQVDQTWLAIDLTLAGALTTVSALVNAHRRWLGWSGLALLTLAQWVRMVEVGVETPEAYTLPLALILIVVGVLRMRRDPALRSATALSPGLLLALVPSLALSLDDPVSVRALLLGSACVVVLGAGAGLRWSSPLVIAAVIGVILVLREMFHAYVPPQWVVIGIIGIALTAVGVTWESRLADVKRATGYLQRLR